MNIMSATENRTKFERKPSQDEELAARHEPVHQELAWRFEAYRAESSYSQTNSSAMGEQDATERVNILSADRDEKQIKTPPPLKPKPKFRKESVSDSTPENAKTNTEEIGSQFDSKIEASDINELKNEGLPVPGPKTLRHLMKPKVPDRKKLFHPPALPKKTMLSLQKPDVPEREKLPQAPPVSEKKKVPVQKPDVPERRILLPQKPDVPDREQFPQSPAVPDLKDVPLQKPAIPERKMLAKKIPEQSILTPLKESVTRDDPIQQSSNIRAALPERQIDPAKSPEMHENLINNSGESLPVELNWATKASVPLRKNVKEEQLQEKLASNDKRWSDDVPLNSRFSNSSTESSTTDNRSGRSSGPTLSSTSAESRMSTASSASSASYGSTEGGGNNFERNSLHEAQTSFLNNTFRRYPSFECSSPDISWRETPEVKKWDVHGNLDPKKIDYQESLFKIITSEDTYRRHLSYFVELFVNHPFIAKGPDSVISDSDRKELFSNILAIDDVSKRLIIELEDCWRQSPMISMDIFDILSAYATDHFKAYVPYCANLNFQENTLRRLKGSNEKFRNVVEAFEAQQREKFPVNKFLTLPVRRITELLRLVQVVHGHAKLDTPEHNIPKRVADQLQKLIDTFTAQGLQNISLQRIAEIDKLLDFKAIKKIPIVSPSRRLNKEMSLTRIFKENKGLFGSKKKETLHLFLFDDLLLITKKKVNPSSDGKSLKVIDYAYSEDIEAEIIDGNNFTAMLPNGAPPGCNYLFVLQFNRNHERKTAQFIFACNSMDARTKWLIEFDGSEYEEFNVIQHRISVSRNRPMSIVPISLSQPPVPDKTHAVQNLYSAPPVTEESDCSVKITVGDETFHQGYKEMGNASGDSITNRSNRSGEVQSGPAEVVRSFSETFERIIPNNQRPLWCKMPEVLSSGILDSIPYTETIIQERLFEIITSEATYLKSLSTFVELFVKAPYIAKGPDSILSDNDRNDLFSNILAIEEVSKRFMHSLENYFLQNIKLSTDLCDILSDYANNDFKEYVNYCAYHSFQDRKMRELRGKNEAFCERIAVFEAQQECHNLPIQAFLLMPVQRIQRMPLLIDAVFNLTKPNTPEWSNARRNLVLLQKFVATCDEKTKQFGNIEENTEIDRLLDFGDIKKIPVAKESKSIVKKGTLTRIFQKKGKEKRESLDLFLFNDLLIITKKKVNAPSDTRSRQVIDHARREMLVATNVTHIAKDNLFKLVLLENHHESQVEFLFACESVSEKIRWLEAVKPPEPELEDEKIYAAWDCPRVEVTSRYVARQPDELTLEVSEVIRIYRKYDDGWYEGERVQNGQHGWFMEQYTQEIQDHHVKARNLRHGYGETGK